MQKCSLAIFGFQSRYFILKINVFFHEKFPGCGGIFHSANGTIKSPHWPQTFPENSRCSWTVITHESKHWEISFDSNFRIPSSDSQCQNSFVKVGAHLCLTGFVNGSILATENSKSFLKEKRVQFCCLNCFSVKRRNLGCQNGRFEPQSTRCPVVFHLVIRAE